MITLDRDLCFLDCETLGLDPAAAIWEFAAIRVNRDGTLTRDQLHCQILHQPGMWSQWLPEPFAADYQARFDMQAAIPPAMAAKAIQAITDGAIIAGSNPAFDIERLTRLLARFDLLPGWHFHPLDIPSMVVGWVASLEFGASLKWKSDALSSVAGVPSSDYPRHTAMGDVQWCLAQWRAMTADEPEPEPEPVCRAVASTWIGGAPCDRPAGHTGPHKGTNQFGGATWWNFGGTEAQDDYPLGQVRG